MIIGVPSEIKPGERRVALVPTGVRELTLAGQTVLFEAGAGIASGHTDDEYESAGAVIVATADSIFGDADIIVKVKEPMSAEFALLRKGQVLFCYLHLAAHRELVEALTTREVTAIAYETVGNSIGGYPLLAPMSMIAGRMAIQAAARALEGWDDLGAGILMSGVPGVKPASVVVIGGGVVGENAAWLAAGYGAEVTVLDVSVNVLDRISRRFGNQVRTLLSTSTSLLEAVSTADVVVAAVLVPGSKAPRILGAGHVSAMKSGSVIVDVAIDQGGAVETSRPTTHSDPTYQVDGVVHYAVTNMPAAVPRTASAALNNSTISYILEFAVLGFEESTRRNPDFLAGVNCHQGHLTHAAVAASHGLKHVAVTDLLG